MNHALFVAIWTAVSVTSPVFAAEPAPRSAALWQYIHYPSLEIPGPKDGEFEVLVNTNGHIEGQRPMFLFDLLWVGASDQTPPAAIENEKETTVRLHLPGGTIVEPKEKHGPASAGGSHGMTWSRIFEFPWGANKLEEGWFELRIAGRTYWLEVPYGFMRDPLAPLAPVDTKSGLPTLAPAMKKLGPDDWIVPWEKIDYDLGVIQNGWQLSLEQSNPFDAESKVTLYREGGNWELDRPKTAVEIAEDGGGKLGAKQVGTRLTDLFRRVDEYFFLRDPGSDIRDWGTLTISVDGISKSIVIPSSLFKYTHGIAEPYHPRRIRLPSAR